MDEFLYYVNNDTQVMYVSKGKHYMYVTAGELLKGKQEGQKPKMPLKIYMPGDLNP